MNEDKAVDKIMGIISTSTAICPACGMEKSLDCFYRDNSRPNGHKKKCKACDVPTDRKIKAVEIKNQEYKITLDFSKVKFGIDLLNKLKQESEESLRTLENEIFFMLKDIV